MILIFDASTSGLSGDKIVASLLDLGGSESVLKDVAEAIGCKVRIGHVVRGGIKAKTIELKEEVRERDVKEIKDVLRNGAETLKLSQRARELANRALDLIVEAEAKVHGFKKVHLHEIGSLDTPFDILSTVALLEDLNLLNVQKLALPIALGGGAIDISHGLLPVPAPATLEILRMSGLRAYGGPINEELTTPTGMGILAALEVRSVEFLPLVRPVKVGYGAGSKKLEIPNIMRVILAESNIEGISVLETDIDDIDGETLGHVLERLLSEGALDVSFLPRYGKKSRPGYRVSVIVKTSEAEKITSLLMEETGTLGVRIFDGIRHIASREMKEVDVRVGGHRDRVRVKVSVTPRGTYSFKPEFEDLARISKITGLSLKKVRKVIYDQVEKKLREGS
jgi:hypothetical protein